MLGRSALLATLSLLVACGGGSSSPPAAAPIAVHSATPSGDVLMSGNVGVSGGHLTVALAAVRDPDDPTRPADPASVDFTISTAPAGALVAGVAGGPSLSCDVAGVSATSVAMIDLVFINDTTGSMAGTVNGIADSVESFATAIAGSVDARFSMYTYGDAFATRLATASEFTIGHGDLGVPVDLDDVERPYLGLSSLATFKSFLGELRASSALGNGGNDEPENTIGTLDYANRHLAFRAGAAKVFVAVGDNPSHQQGDGDVASWPAAFQPATGASLVSRIAGSATIHVVGNDTPDATYYNLKGLADGTGGVFLQLPGDGVVDLGALNLTQWLTSAFSGTCSTAPKGHYLVILGATVHGSGGTTKTGTLTFDITVS